VSQQINLYQPIFRKERIVFSARTIVWLCLGLATLLMLWSVLISQRISGLESELARQQAAEQHTIRQIAELQAALPPADPQPELVIQVEQLEARRNGLRESLAALERRLPASRVDLRSRLDALAGQIPDGMWLTGLQLGDQGRSLTLHGAALEAALVATYLARLSEVPSLSGTGFSQLRLENAADERPGIRFTISTSENEP